METNPQTRSRSLERRSRLGHCAGHCAQAEGYELYALSFSYGQRHVWDSKRQARRRRHWRRRSIASQHIDLRVFGGSALTADIAVPKGRDAGRDGHGIPITYVPARNTIFLRSRWRGPRCWVRATSFIGVNALDYSGYPDCRPEFIEAFEKMANLATKAGVEGRQHLKIHTPLIALTKAQIIRQGNRTGRGLRADQQLLRSVAGGRAVRAMRLLPVAAERLPRKRNRRSAGIEESFWLLKVSLVFMVSNPRRADASCGEPLEGG